MISVNRGTVFQQIDRLYRDGTLAGLGDGQLLERYLTHGDEAAFETLIDVHGPMVLGLCRRVLRDPRDIEDAFQATFLILVRKAPTIRDRGLLSNWLYGVAYRVARRVRAQTLRRRHREIGVENLEVPAAPEITDAVAMGSELDQELNRLPRKYRVPLILCYLKGRTHDQAAEEMACPVGTVRSRLARGRDLLRRRLTARGHASMAGILGPNTALPVGLFSESVPASLVSATVKAVVDLGASQTLQAGAVGASALALSQGVLTTMRIAQLKLISLATVTTSLSAGAVIAVACAAGQGQATTGQANGAPTTIPQVATSSSDVGNNASPPTKAAAQTASESEKRLKALEQKLDQVLSRLNAPLTEIPPKSGGATATLPTTTRAQEPASTLEPKYRSVRELEVELKLAIENDERTERLFKSATVSLIQWEQARARVLLIRATLEGRVDELSEEIERLKLEINTKRAELQKSHAQKEVAMSVVARNARLNERKKGMVAAEDVAKGEWELKSAAADVAIAEAQIAQVELRVLQLEQRRQRIKQVIKIAERTEPNPTATPAKTNGGSTP